jgi:hypothetical protein
MTVFNTEPFIRKPNGDWRLDGGANTDAYSLDLDGIKLYEIPTNHGKGYRVIEQQQQDEPNGLPDFEVGLRTRNCCLVALFLTWAVGIALLVVGVIFLQNPQSTWMSRGVRVELASLAINICLTGLLEGNGFIHTTALRWALHLEGRLTFNSNLRLFTSSSTSKPNSWYCNAFYAITTITAYASASLFFQKAYNKPGATVVHPIALLLLGSSLVMMATLVTWSYLGEKDSLPA